MLKKIIEFFTGKTAEVTNSTAAPAPQPEVKVETVAEVVVKPKFKKKDLDSMDKKGLLALAEENGVKANARMTKVQLIDKLLGK
jgi:hypothetical protein